MFRIMWLSLKGTIPFLLLVLMPMVCLAQTAKRGASHTVSSQTFRDLIETSGAGGGGYSWTAVNNGLPTYLDVLALAIDPLTPSTLYAGANGVGVPFSPHGGVFKSTDGGNNWSAMNKGLTNIRVATLDIDPLTPSTVYAGTFATGTNRGVFKSTNGGNNWSLMSTGLPSDLGVLALAINPTTPDTLYAGTNGGVFKSTNGGSNWSAVNNGLPSESNIVVTIAIDPSKTSTLYLSANSFPFGAPGNGVYKSIDGGGNWTAVNNGLPPNPGVFELAIDPITPSTLYAATSSGEGVFKSTDGGNNWMAVSNGLPMSSGVIPNVISLAIDPSTPSTLYCGPVNLGVYKSIDGGNNWMRMNNGLLYFAPDPRRPSPIFALTIDPNAPSTLYAGTGYGVFKSTGNAVVLIHGITGSNASWGDLKALLEAEGYTVKYFSYPPNFFVPLEDLAQRLNDSLAVWNDELHIDELGVDIIGHSMGGLISRYFIAHPNLFPFADDVNELITLGTPNYGALAAVLGILIPGTDQGHQMQFGSEFLWDLHQTWVGTSISTEVLSIAGANNNFSDDYDGTVLLPSANLENLGPLIVYVPKSHSGSDGLAQITDVSHPSYVTINTFLSGQEPQSNEGNVSQFIEGMLILRLFDPNGIPVNVSTLFGFPQVFWSPKPTFDWPPPWPPGLGHGVNSNSGIYFATGVEADSYSINVTPVGGFSTITIEPVIINPRQTTVISATVFPANQSTTQTIASGNPPPIPFGNTDVAMDFSSGPGGEVTVYKFDENPPAAEVTTLPHYWDIITDMPNDSFSAIVTFNYDESEVLNAGLTEENLVVAFFDSIWHSVDTAIDIASNKVSINTTHLSLFSIGNFVPTSPGLVFRVERTTGDVFAKGSFIPSGADIAERINVSEPVEPGDIVELDPTKPGCYRKARGNSYLIGGVITTKPGFTLGNNSEELQPATVIADEKGLELGAAGRPLLALVGRVPVKATTENGPISPGELLTVSSKPGYAMRCAEAKGCEGAIIGKALEGLERGEELILVLVMSP